MRMPEKAKTPQNAFIYLLNRPLALVYYAYLAIIIIVIEKPTTMPCPLTWGRLRVWTAMWTAMGGRLSVRVGVLMLAFTLASTFALPAQALQVTDDRGVTVTFAQSPQRIVSLLPSLTETVCELGQCQRLIGVDRYSNYPTSVLALPKTGGGLDPNIEAVVALRPDAVLLSVSSRASERLEALGLKVVALEPKTHADVRRVLETDRKSTRLNSSHHRLSRMPSSA